MTISNLRVNADTTLATNAIHKQQGEAYEEDEYVMNGTEKVKATSVGMFAKLVKGAVVKNLTIDVSEVYATGVNFVGTIAGQVIDSRIFNVNIKSSDATNILGGNIVGGVAGRISGQSTIVNVENSVSVSAYYYGSENKVNRNNLEEKTIVSQYTMYTPSKTVIDANTKKVTSYTPSNYSLVSFAGGVAGVIDLGSQDAEGSTSAIDVTAIGRIRSTRLTGAPTIIGEVVGGLYGYLGKNSMLTASAIIVEDNTTLDASRVAGGLVGANFGYINRSYAENVDQSNIDSVISALATNVTQVYGDEIDTGNTVLFGGNPHYIGGIAGINIAGSIINTYNKINVSNIDAAYAGGIVGANIGGNIRSVYTTADVWAFYGVGGIIGLHSSLRTSALAKYDTNVQFYNDHLVSHIENLDEMYGDSMDTNAALNMSAVVAANIWKLQSLNQRRAHLSTMPISENAYIGTIIGYADTATAEEKTIDGKEQFVIKDSDIAVGSSNRYLKEDMYTSAAYTYDTITNYINNEIESFVLVNEIGNLHEEKQQPNAVDINRTAFTNADNKTYLNHNNYSANGLASGNVLVFTKEASSINISETDKYHYSRLRKLSSVRTLKEILARVYIQDEAISMINKLKRKDSTDNVAATTIENLAYSINKVTFDGAAPEQGINYLYTGETKRQQVYILDGWDAQVWTGTQVDAFYEKTDENIWPSLINNVSDTIKEIWTYQDLKDYTKLYPNGTFYLMRDIEVDTKAEPLCSMGNPFTGQLLSNPFRTDTSNPYTITINTPISGENASGLFAAVKGATFKDFNVVVNDKISVSSASGNGAVGVLFGLGYSKGYQANTIEKVAISFGAQGSIEAASGSKYVGGVGGYVDALYIKGVIGESEHDNVYGVTISNPKINVLGETSVDEMFIGAVAGEAIIQSVQKSVYIIVDDPKITVKTTFAKGGYNTLGIGAVFGKVSNTNASSGEYTLDNITVNNPEIEIELTAKDGKDGKEFVYFETVGIGGVFGLVEGLNTKTPFTIKEVNVNKTTNYKLSVKNNGVYAYSPIYESRGNFSVGGVVGQVGGGNKGNVILDEIKVNAGVNNYFTYEHTNTSTHITNAKTTSDVNLGSTIGSVLSCTGAINAVTSELLFKWTVTELDKVNINIGHTIGKMNAGSISNAMASTNIQNVVGNADELKPITLGKKTRLNIGGLVGVMNGGSISNSGFDANIIVYTSSTSTNNINLGGLVGYANVDSMESAISGCFAYGKIALYSIDKSSGSVDMADIYGANIGGLVGKVFNSIEIKFSVTANDIIAYNGTLAAGTTLESDGDSCYNAIGGFIGLLEADDAENFNFNLYSVYSISNTIINKSDYPKSEVGGLVGKACSTEGYDISGAIVLDNAYYLAEFMIDTNSIGIAGSVDTMLINNGEMFLNSDELSYWNPARTTIGATPTYVYPVLKDAKATNARLTPTVLSVFTQAAIDNIKSSSSAIVVTASILDETITDLGGIKDIYFVADSLEIKRTIFTTIPDDVRVYGLKAEAITAPIINTNNGKVTATTIKALSSETGYIVTNNGLDINPKIEKTTGNDNIYGILYTTNNGVVLYADVTMSNDSLIASGGDGELRLSVIKYSGTIPTNNGVIKVVDSYFTNGTSYHYYNHIGQSQVLSSEQAKDITKFTNEYDFYNDWIIFNIPEEYEDTDDYSINRRNGRAFLRWELKQTIGQDWYFEDIDLYSNSQTAYKDYVWNNYVNELLKDRLFTLNSINVAISMDTITIGSAAGLAYVSNKINNSEYNNYKIVLNADIDLEGRLFTPIGGALIFGKSKNNTFAGTFDGKGKTIYNMNIITNSYAGLFGSSSSTSYKDLSIENAYILSSGESVGGLVARQENSADIYKVSISKTSIINLMQTAEEIDVVGGLVGLVYNNKPEDRKLDVVIQKSGLEEDSSVYNGDYVGGLVGSVEYSVVQIYNCYNDYTIKGTTRVGGLLGSVSEDSKVTISSSHNLGDVIATAENSYAGGLIGYHAGTSTKVEISYNSSYVEGYYAAGMIGYVAGNATFHHTYVSRGDIGAVLGGVENTRNDSDPSVTNNMNVNSIISKAPASSGAEYAFAYTADSAKIVISQSYSSLFDEGSTTLGLTFTNNSTVTYSNSYIIADSDNLTGNLKTITHASLSLANNEIFENWKDIWSRVSQKNNNYPSFMESAWVDSDVNFGDADSDVQIDGKTYWIRSEEGLAWVAQQVNSGENYFVGSTVIVEDGLTIDFSKKLWYPIGHSEERSFQGTFIFQNNVIKNMTTNGYYKDNIFSEANLVPNYVGLFGYTKNATLIGSVEFATDETTLNEGSHITTEASYAGALVGYAKDTVLSNLKVENHLNVQGTSGYVGGIIGCLQLVTKTDNIIIESLINYGTVAGKSNDSQNIGGIIGAIIAPNGLNVNISANKLINYGEIGGGSGSSSGLIALVSGEKISLYVNTAMSTASIENSGSELGGLFGKCTGSLEIENAIISNDSVATASTLSSIASTPSDKITIKSNNTNAYIGAIIGYGNIVKINSVTYDRNGIKISSQNLLNSSRYEVMSGAVGGLVGRAYKLIFEIGDKFTVENIEFEHLGMVNETNNIGGIAGRVDNEFLVTPKSNISSATLTVTKITGMKGIGYIGGIAGYVGKYRVEKVETFVNDVYIEDVTDKESDNYKNYLGSQQEIFDNTFGNIGGAFGYIDGGIESNKLELSKITTNSSNPNDYYIKAKSVYVGGVVGRIGTNVTLKNISNGLSIKGDLVAESKFIGGIVGFINSTTALTFSDLKNYASVSGYEYVGGLVGKVNNVTISNSISGTTASPVVIGDFDDANIIGTWYAGGFFGEASTVVVYNSQFTGSLRGSNYIGGLIGVAKDAEIRRAVINIEDFFVDEGKKTSRQVITDNVTGEKVYATGGVVGYSYAASQTKYTNIINVDVEIGFKNDTTINVPFGGVVGYGSQTNIKEASTDLKNVIKEIIKEKNPDYGTVAGASEFVDKEVINLSVYGIAHSLHGTEYSVNWHSNQYWMLKNSDSMGNIYMAFVDSLESEKVIEATGSYDDTVIYKAKGASTFTITNGNQDDAGFERVKQIYLEAGLWDIGATNASTTKEGVTISNPSADTVNISMSKDMDDRDILVEPVSNVLTLEITSADQKIEYKANKKLSYRQMYLAFTKRYNPNVGAVTIHMTLEAALSDVYTKVVNSTTIVNPLGSYYFPAKVIKIEGVSDVSTINLKAVSDKVTYALGSSEEGLYNLYGFIGFAYEGITIKNIKLASSNGANIVNEKLVHYDMSNDTYLGAILATGATYKAEQEGGSKLNKQNLLENVTNSININSSAYVTSGIVGIISTSHTNTTYTTFFKGVTNTGAVTGREIVAGILGYAEFLGAQEEGKEPITVTLDIQSYKLSESKIYGVKNEGNIKGTNLGGGVMGYIGPSVSFVQKNTAGTRIGTYEESALLIWNAGNITMTGANDTVVGGVIGAYVTDQATPIRNLYSGNMSFSNGIYTAVGSNTYSGKIVGGLIGYGALAANGGTDGDGNATENSLTVARSVNMVKVGSTDVKISSAAIAAVEAGRVTYQYLINRGNVEGTVKNMGGFFSDAEYEMTTFSTSTTERTVYSYSTKKNAVSAVEFNNIIHTGSVKTHITGTGIYVGGFIGNNDIISDITINGSYVSGGSSATGGAEAAGGFIGLISGGTVTFKTDGNYENILAKVSFYENKGDDGGFSNSASGKYAGGMVGLVTSGALRGHISNGFDISKGKSVSEAISENTEAYKVVSDHLDPNGRSFSGSGVGAGGSRAAGGIIGAYKAGGTLLFTNIGGSGASVSANPVVNGDNPNNSLGGVIGLVENVSTLAFHGVGAGSATGTNVFTGGFIGEVQGKAEDKYDQNIVNHLVFEGCKVSSSIKYQDGAENGWFAACVGGLVGFLNDIEPIVKDINVIGLTIKSTTNKLANRVGGLFGQYFYVDTATSFENVLVESSEILAEHYESNNIYRDRISVGGLIGTNYGDIEFIDCKIDSGTEVKAVGFGSAAGGFIGTNAGDININAPNLRSEGKVAAQTYPDKIPDGIDIKKHLKDDGSTEDVAFKSEHSFPAAGGFVGYNSLGHDITLNYGSSNINVYGFVAGGIVGYQDVSTGVPKISIKRSGGSGDSAKFTIESCTIAGELYIGVVIGMASTANKDALKTSTKIVTDIVVADSTILQGNHIELVDKYIELTKQKKGTNNYKYLAKYEEIITEEPVSATGSYSYTYTDYNKNDPIYDTDGETIIGYNTKQYSVTGGNTARGSYISYISKSLIEKEKQLVNTILEDYKISQLNEHDNTTTEIKHNASYDLYFGNRTVTDTLPSSIKINASNAYDYDKKEEVFKVAYAITVADDEEAAVTKTYEGVGHKITNLPTVTGSIPGMSTSTIAHDKGLKALNSMLLSEIQTYISEQETQEFDNREEQIASISQGLTSVAYQISDTIQIYRVYHAKDMLAAFVMQDWMTKVFKEEDGTIKQNPFNNPDVNAMYHKVFSQALGQDQANLLRSALFYQDARMSSNTYRYILAVNLYDKNVSGNIRNHILYTNSKSTYGYPTSFMELSDLPNFKYSPGTFWYQDASGKAVRVYEEDVTYDANYEPYYGNIPLYTCSGTITWDIDYVFANMTRARAGDKSGDYMWATDCCGYVRLSNAIAGIPNVGVGYYGNVGGETFGTKANMDANLKPGDIINTSTSGHVIMFMYAEDTDGDGENDNYVISDQSNLLRNMHWDEENSCLRMTNSSDKRYYNRAFRIAKDAQ